jgi:preprotein translocase subunit SecF
MNFMKFRYLYFIFSAFFLVPGIISLALYGLRPAIDFTGGSLWELKVTQQEEVETFVPAKISEVVGDAYELSSVQKSGTDSAILRGKAIGSEQRIAALTNLQKEFGPLQDIRFETVGPTLGAELLRKTLFAVAMVSIIITLYVGWQFKSLKYGVSAILAMFHDSLMLLGAFSLLGHFFRVEVDVLFVTALLTTLSFSVHDTIVVFDRIRELRRKHDRMPFIEVANAAVLETLSRSINNSMTIIIMLLALVLLGGETTYWFGVALLIGAVTGTYSSTFTAVPLVVVWDQIESKRKKK